MYTDVVSRFGWAFARLGVGRHDFESVSSDPGTGTAQEPIGSERSGRRDQDGRGDEQRELSDAHRVGESIGGRTAKS